MHPGIARPDPASDGEPELARSGLPAGLYPERAARSLRGLLPEQLDGLRRTEQLHRHHEVAMRAQCLLH